MRDDMESPIDTALNAQVNQPVPGDGKTHGDFPSQSDVEREGPKHGKEHVHAHPHPASRLDAGTGQGTVSGPPYGEALQERPVLDGSTENVYADGPTEEPSQ